jgi:hypothetical protein
MDFPAEVNDSDSEPKSCLFQDVDGETDAPDDKAMRPFNPPDQGIVSDPNHYDQKTSNRQADARPALGK